MAIIELEKMEFVAFHGCHPQERLIGNKFNVWVSLSYKTELAEKSDKLSDTINYQSIYNLVKEEMQIPSNLLEHIARRILNHIKNKFTNVGQLKVKISKLNPALGGQVDAVSVTLSD